MAENRVRRSWVPIPHGLPVDRGLGLQVVSELRERIPFRIPVLSRYALVAAGEHNGLKNYAVDLIGVAESEAHDLSHAIIVETVDHGNLQGGLHSSRSDVLQRAELHFHVISKPAMFVLLLGDAIELQVHAVQPGGASLDSKISAFRKTNTIGRNVKTMEAHALRVSNCVKKDRRECGLATGEQDVDFAVRLERARPFKNRLQVFHICFVDVTNSVSVHEARSTHHVASVGQIHDQIRPSACPDTVRAVVVDLTVTNAIEVAPQGLRFHSLKEIGMVR
jgi:hypothetical protein